MEVGISIEKSNLQTSKTFDFAVLPEKGDIIGLSSEMFDDVREFLEFAESNNTSAIVKERIWMPRENKSAEVFLELEILK